MVNTLMLADGIYIAVNRLAQQSGFAMEEAAGIEASVLDGAVAELEEAVEAAIIKDEDANWRFWEEFRSVIDKGLFQYWQDRRDFEARGQEKIDEFRLELSGVKDLVNEVKSAAGAVPGKLENDAAAWAGAAEEVNGMRSRIAAMQQIPGWTGSASGGYTRRNMVQDAATAELGGMATSMSNALTQLALFNRALFLVMKREIQDAAKDVRQLGGADGYHYVRTVNGIALLRALLRRLDASRSGEPVRDASSQLESLVSDCLASPQVLQADAWPSGGGMAGVPPGQTDTVPNPDAQTRVDDPSHRPSTGNEDDYVERNDGK